MSDAVDSTEVVVNAPPKKPRKARTKARKPTPEDSTTAQDEIKPPQSVREPAKKKPNTNPTEKAKKKSVHTTPLHSSTTTLTHLSSPPNRPKNHAPSKTAWLFKSTGSTLYTIDFASLLPSPTPVTCSTPSTLLCSYNWVLSSHTILVPGGPPKWTPPALPHALPPDTGLTFIDQNAARMPQYPFEPAFRALAATSPSLKLNDVDIVVNRNSLRKLLDFAGGKSQDPFRMGLCMVGRTLFISRHERAASRNVKGRAPAGYGHSFEKAFTTPGEGLAGCSSHHRVLRYRLGSLDCVVRFEVDAYVDEAAGFGDGQGQVREGAEAEAEAGVGDEHMHVDGVINALETTTLHTTAAAANPKSNPKNKNKNHNPNPSPKNPLQVHTTPPPKTPTPLAELKTHSLKKSKSPPSPPTPQLYLARTPHLITGLHKNGVVSATRHVDMSARFAGWEEANQERLRKMVGLLEGVREVVGGLEGRREREAVLVWERGGGCRVLGVEGGGGGVLPGELVERFWGV